MVSISFGRVGSFVSEKLEERKRRVEAEKKEQAELARIQKEAEKSERLRLAPKLGQVRARAEYERSVKAASMPPKPSGLAGVFSDIRARGPSMGAFVTGGGISAPSMGSGFGNVGYGMFGQAPTKSGKQPATNMFGIPITQEPSSTKRKHVKKHRKPKIVGYDMWNRPIYG